MSERLDLEAIEARIAMADRKGRKSWRAILKVALHDAPSLVARVRVLEEWQSTETITMIQRMLELEEKSQEDKDRIDQLEDDLSEALGRLEKMGAI